MPLRLPAGAETLARILRALRDAVTSIPSSSEHPSPDRPAQAERLSRSASLRAAAVSGALSVPPGPAGLLTVLPDVLLVWKIQAQLVSDLAAAYGKSVLLTPEGLLHCLFRHAAAQAVRGMVVQAARGFLIRRASAEVFDAALRRVGLSVAERVAGKALSRWVPVLGAVGVGAYAYYDTRRIAKTAVEVFESDLAVGD
jgi:hypothetical protein